MTDDRLRIGDAEREAAAADLGEHFAQGRLTAEEHTERLDRVWAARTRGDLAPPFADLPSPFASPFASPFTGRTLPLPPERGARPTSRFPGRGRPAPLVAVVAVLLVITVLTHVPFLLFGLLALWFVTHRHLGRGAWRGAWRGHHPGWR